MIPWSGNILGSTTGATTQDDEWVPEQNKLFSCTITDDTPVTVRYELIHFDNEETVTFNSDSNCKLGLLLLGQENIT